MFLISLVSFAFADSCEVFLTMKLILVHFLLLLSFPCAFGLRKDFKMPKYNNALTRAVVEIVQQFYLERTTTLNFYHASIDDDEKSYERNLDTMNEILYQLQSTVVVQLEGATDFAETKRKRVHNIIFIDSYESFWTFFSSMSPSLFEYQGFYLFVLTTYSHQQYPIMKEIFDWLWTDYIVNANIVWLAPQNDDEAILYTYYPYTRFFCGKAVPIQLNQFRFGVWLQSQSSFFPEKMENLHGCPLTVSTVFSPPFMIFKQRENGEIYTDGIDGVLLRVLAQRMNFSVILIQVDDQGSVDENGTGTGKVKLLIKVKLSES